MESVTGSILERMGAPDVSRRGVGVNSAPGPALAFTERAAAGIVERHVQRGAMSFDLPPEHALPFWHLVMRGLVTEPGADLSVRQMAILLTIYLTPPPHTVRGLAAALGVTKPVITRALDSLGKLDLVARRRDDVDRRNVIVQRTVQGRAHLDKLGRLICARAAALDIREAA